jgi:hypothetical protein
MAGKRKTSIGWWLAAVVGLSACVRAPLAGSWQGTVDLAGATAWQVALQLDPEESSGEVRVHSDGKGWNTYRLCRVTRDRSAIELEYDANRPGCEAQGPTPSERVVLRGTVGETVLFGEVLRAGVRHGFFRAWWTPPAAVPLAPAATASSKT